MISTPAASAPSPRWSLPLWLALMMAIPAGSTAVLFIKASHVPPLWLAADRLLIAAVMILPLAIRDLRRRSEGWRARDFIDSLAPALALAIHFCSWIIGARLAPAVDATLIGNLLPVTMPIIVFLMVRELPNAREMVAGVIGMVGVGIMAGMATATPGHGHEAHGDALCAFSLLAVAVYLALARKLRRGQLWIYLVPVYAIAGVICALAALIVEGPPQVPSGHELLLVLGLAFFPTVIAHSIYNRAMAEMRPNTLGILNLLQCPLAGITAWLLWSERPSLGFWMASVGIVCAFAILVYPALRTLLRPELKAG